jgi:hypothetical protein
MMRRDFRHEVTESDVKIATPAGLDHVSRTVPLELRSINVRVPRVTSDRNIHHDFVVPCSQPINGKRSATPWLRDCPPEVALRVFLGSEEGTAITDEVLLDVPDD